MEEEEEEEEGEGEGEGEREGARPRPGEAREPSRPPYQRDPSTALSDLVLTLAPQVREVL